MRISLLCSHERHPANAYLVQWMESQRSNHQIELVRSKNQLTGGDLLFLVSCTEIVSAKDRAAYRATLVLHASDLPLGRGWSPHIWQIIEGSEEITLSLLEAEDKVDSGRIWKKLRLPIPKDALWDEINKILIEAEVSLLNFAVDAIDNIYPLEQSDEIKPTHYPRRSPTDSQIDPEISIASQFDKIRVCDPDRFPAFFHLYGKKYKITLEKIQ